MLEKQRQQAPAVLQLEAHNETKINWSEWTLQMQAPFDVRMTPNDAN